MQKFSFLERAKNLHELGQQSFDLLIIGGGITGAGVARDAALRGMKVALVEAQDFASGTSSRSSKLVHGGIRYLENLEFKLVFEALNERNKLFEMCPHLVHHLRFMIPLYDSSRVGMAKMGLGMWFYDALALFQAPELHERLNPRRTLDRMPTLRAEGLLGSYVYSDGYMDDDRLVHETLRSAATAGALCLNYTRAAGAVFDSENKIQSVIIKDLLLDQTTKVHAKHVVSCVGPWTDDLCQSMIPTWKKVLRPTKGVHFTLPRHRINLPSAVVMAAEKDNRIVFGIPRHEMVIIGTTDTDYTGDPGEVSVTSQDIDYLLGFTSHYFPGAKLNKEDILAGYAGVRPLVHDGSQSEGKTSREHTIQTLPSGITYVAGGKYTTYRLMSEHVVEACLKEFSIEERVQFARAQTTRPLNDWTGVEAYSQAQSSVDLWAQEFQRTPDFVQHFTDRYGLEAEIILKKYDHRWNLWQLEAAQAIEQTMCLQLTDFFTRRVPLFLADENHGLSNLDSVAEVFQRLLHWNDGKTEEQKSIYRKYVQNQMAWRR